METVVKNLPIVGNLSIKEELDQLDYRSKKELTGQVRIVEIQDTMSAPASPCKTDW